jgi:hypothetical protein
VLVFRPDTRRNIDDGLRCLVLSSSLLSASLALGLLDTQGLGFHLWCSVISLHSLLPGVCMLLDQCTSSLVRTFSCPLSLQCILKTVLIFRSSILTLPFLSSLAPPFIEEAIRYESTRKHSFDAASAAGLACLSDKHNQILAAQHR